MSRTGGLLSALTHANVGSFLRTPPGLDGEPGLGLVAAEVYPL